MSFFVWRNDVIRRAANENKISLKTNLFVKSGNAAAFLKINLNHKTFGYFAANEWRNGRDILLILATLEPVAGDFFLE